MTPTTPVCSAHTARPTTDSTPVHRASDTSQNVKDEFSTGLGSTDLRSLRVGDVTDTDKGISIDVDGRTVWVLEHFCDIVRVGLSVDRGDGWLLAGRNGQRRNISEYVDRFTLPASTPRLNLSRGRATWIVDHLNRGTPVTVICDALGVAGLGSIERVLRYAEPVDADTRARLLRGTP